MPRQNERKLPNFKGILTVVGIIFIIIGFTMVVDVNAQSDTIMYRTGVPLDDFTDTITDDNDSGTGDDPVNPPTGVAELNFYGQEVYESSTGIYLGDIIEIEPHAVEGGLYTESSRFIEFYIEPVVTGDISALDGLSYSIDIVIEGIFAKTILANDDRVSIIGGPLVFNIAGTVNITESDTWVCSERIAISNMIPDNEGYELEYKLVQLCEAAESDSIPDLSDCDISIVANCDMSFGDYDVMAQKTYTLRFHLGDDPAIPVGSIHSVSLYDSSIATMELAQLFMIVGVGIIGFAFLPLDSLIKRNKRRVK